MRSAQRFVKEAGAQAVKLEGGDLMVDRARAIVRAGIPVVGVTFGYTPVPMRELAPDWVIEHFDALPDAVDALLARETVKPAA